MGEQPIPGEPSDEVPGEPPPADALPGSPDEVLAAERAHLALSRSALRAMREHAESLSADTAADPVSRRALRKLLDQRIAALADQPDTPIFFGRLDRAQRAEGDEEIPGTIHVGRRHVQDRDGRPLVIDWLAPVSRAFYRAGPAYPLGVALRRRFGYRGGELTAYEDERLDDDGGRAGPSRILLDEIERPRTGPMRDIVATIQPEQDDVVRADLATTVCVQGAPGTGKTAVGLHRVAYLLFAHRERLTRSGVLIVGPTRTFLSYISSVLPALGEVQVAQSTLDELLGGHTAAEAPVTAEIKGRAVMASVLRRALWMHLAEPEDGLVYTSGVHRYRVPDHQVRAIMQALRRTKRYGPGRAALAQRLAHAVLVRMERRGGSPDDQVHDAVARSRPVSRLVEAVWPKVTPQRVLFRLLSDPEWLGRAAAGDLPPAEQERLLWPRPYRSAKSARWSSADAALLDELADLIERVPSQGHLMVDEAQDLSEMQLRAIGRRCRTGSATVLGDLAQGTTPWSARSWQDVLRHLDREADVIELTLGFRVPGEVLDYAARLLPGIDCGVAAPRSLRPGPGTLTVRPGGLIGEAVLHALARPGSVGVICADAQIPAVAGALDGIPHAVLTDGAADEERVLVVPASLAKGLEYDHVVVVEPADIVAAEPRGLARLYVVLTRAVTSATLVHHKPLPEPLREAVPHAAPRPLKSR